MKRIVAFGCSHTWGHGLPDISVIDHDGNVEPGDEPSEFAWPSLLARRLGVSCLNLSMHGASNHCILMQVLGHKWEHGDTAAILWTHTMRDILYEDDGTVTEVRPPLMRDARVRQYYRLHGNIDMQMRTWLYQDHAAMHCRSAGIQFTMSSMDAWYHHAWQGADHRNVPIDDFQVENWLDLATDGGHAGERTQARWADAFLRSLRD